eukprot:363378-Chlamydomonas_euryale.AAC.3
MPAPARPPLPTGPAPAGLPLARAPSAYRTVSSGAPAAYVRAAAGPADEPRLGTAALLRLPASASRACPSSAARRDAARRSCNSAASCAASAPAAAPSCARRRLASAAAAAALRRSAASAASSSAAECTARLVAMRAAAAVCSNSSSRRASLPSWSSSMSSFLASSSAAAAAARVAPPAVARLEPPARPLRSRSAAAARRELAGLPARGSTSMQRGDRDPDSEAPVVSWTLSTSARTSASTAACVCVLRRWRRSPVAVPPSAVLRSGDCAAGDGAALWRAGVVLALLPPPCAWLLLGMPSMVVRYAGRGRAGGSTGAIETGAPARRDRERGESPCSSASLVSARCADDVGLSGESAL